MFKSKKMVIIIGASLILISFIMSISSVNAFKESATIDPDKYSIFDFTLDDNEDRSLRIASNSSVDIYLLNVTNAGKFLADLSFDSIYTWINKTSLDSILNSEEIAEIMDVNYTEFKNGEIPIQVYVVIENNYELDAKVIIGYNPESRFLGSFRQTMTFARLFFTIYLTAHLFIASKEYREDEEIDKSKMVRGFAYTFLFASINYGVDLFASWYGKETLESFYPPTKFQGSYIPIFDFRVDQIVMLTLLLFSNIFMIYQIEKIVGRKKKPILTILNSISIGLNVILLIATIFVDFIILFFGITVLITLIQIIWIYGTVIRQSKGIIRLKSLCVLCGILLPIIMAMIGGEIINSNGDLSYIIAHSFSIAAIFLIKYGLD